MSTDSVDHDNLYLLDLDFLFAFCLFKPCTMHIFLCIVVSVVTSNCVYTCLYVTWSEKTSIIAAKYT